MRRKLTLALTCLIVACSSGVTACSSKVEKPTFADTEGLTIVAYSGPTVENWSGSSKNVNTLTDEHFQKFVDAGFNCLLAVHEGAPSGISKGKDVYETIAKHGDRADDHAMRALELAEKYNVKYYVRDWPFYDLCSYWDDDVATPEDDSIDTPEEYEKAIRMMLNEDTQYIQSPAYVGNFGRDEPGADQFESLQWQIEIYNQVMAELGVEGEFMLNMLPAYASPEAYGGPRGKGMTYPEYIDLYFEKLEPLLGYISYDYYPFLRDNATGSLMRTTYLSNLELLARKCKESDAELRTFVMTGADFTGLRDMTSVGDFRFQVYCNLAFGSRFITYYEYGTFNSVQEGEFGLINLQDGTYNYTYDLVKVVNNEVRKFEDVLCNYKYDGVMCFSALENKINMDFRAIGQVMENHPKIGEVEVEQNAIMTAMKNANGDDAFMLVNYTDPYYDLDNQVTVEFKDTKALLMYRFGEEVLVELGSDGKYTFDLYPGEGRFIIPLK